MLGSLSRPRARVLSILSRRLLPSIATGLLRCVFAKRFRRLIAVVFPWAVINRLISTFVPQRALPKCIIMCGCVPLQYSTTCFFFFLLLLLLLLASHYYCAGATVRRLNPPPLVRSTIKPLFYAVLRFLLFHGCQPYFVLAAAHRGHRRFTLANCCLPACPCAC